MRKKSVEERDFYTNNRLPMTTPTLPHVLIQNSHATYLKVARIYKAYPTGNIMYAWKPLGQKNVGVQVVNTSTKLKTYEQKYI